LKVCLICGKELDSSQRKYCSSEYCRAEGKRINTQYWRDKNSDKISLYNSKRDIKPKLQSKSLDYTNRISVDLMLEINRHLITLKKKPIEVYVKFMNNIDRKILLKHIERVVGHCLEV